MKAKIPLTILMMVLISLGGLAQKPQKIRGTQPLSSPVFRSSYNPDAHPQINKETVYPFRSAQHNKSHLLHGNTSHRLKTEPAAVQFTEKVDSLYEYMYDTVSMTWKLSGTQYYLYDTRGRNYIFWTASYNPQLLTIIPEMKFQISYSNDDLITEETYSQWYEDPRGWDPFYRYSFTYDVDKKLTERFSYYLDDSITWIPAMRSEYYYDNLGRDTSIIEYSWYDPEWYEDLKTTKKYDASGNLILMTQYQWNGEIFIWDESQKSEYTYDANNQYTQVLYSSSNMFSTDWYITGKNDYTWDANGNVLEKISYDYDTATQVYTPNWKDLYEFDLSVSMENIAMPYKTGDEPEDDAGTKWKNKITLFTGYNWNTATGGFEILEIDSIYYSGLFDNPIDDAVCRADFSSRLNAFNNLLVHFTDKSDSTVVSWYWMFGDGKTSTERNPQHLYASPGTYKVVLTTVDESGFCSNTSVQHVRAGNPACYADFMYTVIPEARELILTNLSEGDNLKYYWNLGDGTVSNASDPVHIYDHPGTYQVTLTITDGGSCMDRYSATIRAASAACDADFAVYVDSSNNTVHLRAKQVLKENRYHWMLGDGSAGNTPNYIHTFSDPGFYTVALTVSNDETGCVESHKETLLIGKESPVGKAGFIFVASEDNTVAFTNQSLGNNLSYIWDFNDGSEPSKEKDLEHTFPEPGYYYVCLTVFQAANDRQDMYCEKIFAGTDTKDQCLARFEYVLSNNGLDIHCLDRSYGKPDEWKWTYNDGSPDTDPNPWWHTDNPAFVKVHQLIRNINNECRDDAFALVNMGEEARLKAGFGYLPGDTTGKKADTYPIDFVGISLGDAGKLKWDFGDGSPPDSTTINPTHHYSAPGPYNVCLTITNTSTGEENTECQVIYVGWAASRKDIEAPDAVIKSFPNPFTESTRIEILLSDDTDIDLSLYDLMGRKIKTIAREQRFAGPHTFYLDGSDLEGGSYYLFLETETGRAEQIINIIK